jgi:hypothetical protein
MSDFTIRLSVNQFFEIFESVCANRESISPEIIPMFKEIFFENWSKLKDIEKKSKIEEWIKNQKKIINKNGEAYLNHGDGI